MNDHLPPGWTHVTLRELADSERGAITDGPFGSKLKTEHYTESGPRVIRLQNIGDGTFIDAKAHISTTHYASLTKHSVIESDIVIAALGETLPRSCLIPSNLGPAIVKADCLRLRPHPQLVIPTFVNYALNSEILREQAASIVHGVGRPRLNMGEMTSLIVPLAPFREQQRIVTALDERLSELDAAAASLNKAERNLSRYRAALLSAACFGKLVPIEADIAKRDGRSYEPADKLLDHILVQRRKASTKARYEEPSKPDTSNLPKLPEGWAWCTTEQIAEVRLGRQRSPDKVSKEHPTKYVRAANLTERGLSLDDVLDMEFTPAEQEIYRLRDGDILVSEASGSPDQVGKSAIWKNEIPGCCFQNTVIRVRPYGESTRYLHLMLSRHYYSGFFARMSAGVGLNHLSAGKFASVPIAFPPLAEQIRIVDEVDRHLTRADALATSIAHAKRRAQRLRRAILATAFQGCLVPQDPKDEPASVLLDRIRAQAAAAEAGSSPSTRRGRPPGHSMAAVEPAPIDAVSTPKRRGRPPGRAIAAVARSNEEANPAPKRRGRPPGSKNKAK